MMTIMLLIEIQLNQKGNRERERRIIKINLKMPIYLFIDKYFEKLKV